MPILTKFWHFVQTNEWDSVEGEKRNQYCWSPLYPVLVVSHLATVTTNLVPYHGDGIMEYRILCQNCCLRGARKSDYRRKMILLLPTKADQDHDDARVNSQNLMGFWKCGNVFDAYGRRLTHRRQQILH